ncbi:MAG: adenylyl-sulfate kinase [Halobacteriovoraceae bacterium]|nr:adenylyl-sulfate kinase [Halobacteriovoraceae bacterium]
MGILYWITGLAGAGKSTIAQSLVSRLKMESRSVVFLDGDVLRNMLGIEEDYSYKARKRIAFTYCRLCKMLVDQNLDVVIATISMFHDCQNWNRKNFARYFEIYVRVPMKVLRKRNQKSLFSQGCKDVVGVDIPAEEPTNPHIVLDNNGNRSAEEMVEEILNNLKEKSI